MPDYTCTDCGHTRDIPTDGEFVLRVGCPGCETVTTHQHLDDALERGPADG